MKNIDLGAKGSKHVEADVIVGGTLTAGGKFYLKAERHLGIGSVAGFKLIQESQTRSELWQPYL